MNHVLSLALFLASAFPLLAVDSPEFDHLRASYTAAIERATNPITQIYLTELEKQKEAYVAASRLEAAKVVQTEIDSIKQAIAAPAQPAKKSEPVVPMKPDAVVAPPVQWIADKTWLTDAKTKWTFSANGTGEKIRGKDSISTFTWKLLDSGLVELGERSAPDKPVKTMFLQFKSQSEAWFGTNQSKLLDRLHRE